MTTAPDPLADALRDALDEEARPDDDDALLARAIAGAMRATDVATATADEAQPQAEAPQAEGAPQAEEAPQPEPVRAAPVVKIRGGRRRAMRVLLPIAAAFVVSAAMAMVVVTRSPVKEPIATPPRPVETAAPPPASPAHESAPSMSVDDLPTALPAPVAPATKAPEPAQEKSAAELFREANTARRGGEVDEAVRLYRALVARYPDASESQASRVSLGRLLLDRTGDAAGALVQFDAYLAGAAADGTLAEEARVGRALALQRLGRTSEERRAWEELVRLHPGSLHVSRARARLDALDGSAGASP